MMKADAFHGSLSVNPFGSFLTTYSSQCSVKQPRRRASELRAEKCCLLSGNADDVSKSGVEAKNMLSGNQEL